MRDLLFKNITSLDKKSKRLSSSEILDKQGVHSVIRRHFVCMAREVEGAKIQPPQPYLYVLKSINHKESKEKFFCRIKGSVYVINSGKVFHIYFAHSLKINLIAMPQGSINPYGEGQ